MTRPDEVLSPKAADELEKMSVPTEEFKEVCRLLSLLQEYKGKRYGTAWCKRGEVISIFSNLARKWDRLEKMVNDLIAGIPFPDEKSEETVAETVADLATYCVLWMTWIQQNRAGEFGAWVDRIQKMVGVEHES